MNRQPTLPESEPPVIYNLVLRNKKPILNAGQTVEVEIYISGYGTPQKNKLHIQWSSGRIINTKRPGVLEVWLTGRTHIKTGLIVPIRLEKPQETPLDATGVTIRLAPHNFLVPLQESQLEDFALGRVATEVMWDDKPPFLLKLNTSTNVPSGDYQITFTFTYGNAYYLLQDSKVVQFHIRNWVESHGWVVPAGYSIAFLSLLITAISTVYKFRHILIQVWQYVKRFLFALG
jgi:hypothetical protein